MAFDPYSRWLGIPPEEQPPTHYRLLGLKAFEDDPNVIRAAAERQLRRIRTFLVGSHLEHCQRLLKEIAAAQACLLDADQKKTYDATLRSQADKSSSKPSELPPALEDEEYRLEPLPAHPDDSMFDLPFPSSPGGAGTAVGAPSGAISSLPVTLPSLSSASPEKASPPKGLAQSRILRWAASIGGGMLTAILVGLIFRALGDPHEASTQPPPAQDATEIAAAVPGESAAPSCKDEPAATLPTTAPSTTTGPQAAREPSPYVLPRAAPVKNPWDSGRSTSGNTSPPSSEDTSTTESGSAGPSGSDAAHASDSSSSSDSPVPTTTEPATPFPRTSFPSQDPFRLLPPRTSIPTNDGIYDLGPVLGQNAGQWRLELQTALANLGGQREFFLASSTTPDPHGIGWRISVRPLANAPPGEGEAVIARFYLEQDRLKFQWASDQTHVSLRPQLLNCIVTLSDGAHQTELILRQPVLKPPAILDLAQKVIHVPLDTPGLPEPQKLVFYVDNVEQFPEGIQVEPVPGRLQTGESLQVRVPSGTPELSGEIELRFQHQGETPGLYIRSWYRSAGRREELTIEHVQSERNILQRKLALDQAELKQAEATLSRTQGAIAKAASRQPANVAEATVLGNQIGSLQSQRSKAATSIRRLSKSIPSIQEALQQIRQVEALGNRLHKKARFHGRLCAVCETHEIVLIQIGTPPRP